MSECEIEAIVSAIKQSKKYQDTNEETIRELATDAVTKYKKTKQAEKAVRRQLHSIMAPYLGDPDYETAAARLTTAFNSSDKTLVKAVCRDIMHHHLSTRERLPLLERFYREIFAVTGVPHAILDIACGLNPLALPWMGLTLPIKYYAYDIHEQRIDFLNHFFILQALPPLARLQDVALDFPQERADVALFLKEMPRFERNYHGLGRPLLQAIRARHLVISFPTVSTHGGRDLTGRYRTFFQELVAGNEWATTELLFPGELVFCIDKGAP